jgi:hypothetical protein
VRAPTAPNYYEHRVWVQDHPLTLGRGRTRLDVADDCHRLYLGTHVPNSARQTSTVLFNPCATPTKGFIDHAACQGWLPIVTVMDRGPRPRRWHLSVALKTDEVATCVLLHFCQQDLPAEKGGIAPRLPSSQFFSSLCTSFLSLVYPGSFP